MKIKKSTSNRSTPVQREISDSESVSKYIISSIQINKIIFRNDHHQNQVLKVIQQQTVITKKIKKFQRKKFKHLQQQIPVHINFAIVLKRIISNHFLVSSSTDI